MSEIRQRLATLSFLVATAIVMVLAAGYGFVHNKPIGASDVMWRDALIGVILGEAFLVGAYLSTGASHRLARAAVFVLGVLLIASVEHLLLRGFVHNADWRRSSAIIGLLASSSAIGATIARFVRSRLEAHRGAVSIRFPLIELFSWTIIVAVACAIFRQSPSWDAMWYDDGARWLGLAGLAGAGNGVALLTLRAKIRHAAHIKRGFATAIAVLVVSIVAAIMIDASVRATLIAALGYNLVFILALAIDACSVSHCGEVSGEG